MMEKLKTALVLVIIGAISGFLIYGANELTEDGIAQIRSEKEQNYYKEIFDLSSDADVTFDFISLDSVLEQEVVLTDSNNQVIGYVYKGTDNNNYGMVTALVGIGVDGKIANVVISNTTNTATFVKNIETNYLSPFSGQDSAAVTFDAKTGATYTYGSVSKIVDLATTYFQENRGVNND
jgi:electron transport complex protein RnfG